VSRLELWAMDGVRGDKSGLGAVAGVKLKSLYAQARKQKGDSYPQWEGSERDSELDGRSQKTDPAVRRTKTRRGTKVIVCLSNSSS
jgi:hypothetical protein